MKIHEYQAKQIFARYGVPLPRGGGASPPQGPGGGAAPLAAAVVVKAQIHAGGRGKGGGIRKAATPADAEKHAAAMLGRPLVTPQTGPQGRVVRRVLVEETLPIERELYLSLVIDRALARVGVMGSAAGGVGRGGRREGDRRSRARKPRGHPEGGAPAGDGAAVVSSAAAGFRARAKG